MTPRQEDPRGAPHPPTAPARHRGPVPLRGVLVWVFAAGAVAALDGHVGVTQQALVMVLASALAGSWLSVPAAVGLSTLAVLVFDVMLVPPRGSLAVASPGQAALLVSLAVVNGLVGALTARLRTVAAEARHEAWRADRQRARGAARREGAHPAAHAGRPRLRPCGRRPGAPGPRGRHAVFYLGRQL